MKKIGFLKHVDFLCLDVLSLLLSYYIAANIRGIQTILNNSIYRVIIIFELLTLIAVVFFYSPYKAILRKRVPNLLFTTVMCSVFQIIILTFILFAAKFSGLVSRLFLGYQYSTFIVLSFSFKVFWIKVIKKKARNSINSGSKSLLIVTTKDYIKDLELDIKNNNFEYFRINGICLLDCEEKVDISDYNVVCGKDNLLKYCCNNWIDSIFFDMDYEQIPKEILNSLAISGITVHLRLMKVEAFEGQDQKVEKVLNYPVLTSTIKDRTNFENFAKRAMDIAGGIVGCLFMVLITILIGPIIFIKSPGPIFYKQKRIGKNGKQFNMYKFRSMVMNADALKKDLMAQNQVKDGFMFKIKNDPRIIPGIGNFIRKTSLDEFPQFINVLKGDMSLVGTRPPTVDEWNKYELRHRIRMAIKPGITGMWQVSGRNKITDFNDVIKLDSYYINNWSLSLDISILFKTVISLLKRDDNEAM